LLIFFRPKKKKKKQQNLQDLWSKLYFKPEPKSSTDTSVHHTDKNKEKTLSDLNNTSQFLPKRRDRESHL
jgi:hypothetical protein